ncbi:inter-alpha-trypsin inhibitor heavy chain H4-like isoform X2 [Hetaerina americana]|uniref:inter-alpha-trypsin inhibitor heavy chain H4-like isoform X2 n=1 Tax=Hetaerina americana TaxID=62018 RepID=UPI003A7F39F2
MRFLLLKIPQQLTSNHTVPEVYSLNIWSNIQYRYATTLVTSSVANRGSNSAEVVFQFFLPQNAFISGFLMEVKGKTYKAYVKEKEEAKKEYQTAIKRGQTAAHIAANARHSNLFAVSVNLEAYSSMTFNLTYEELLARRHGLYDHVIHLVTCNQIIQDINVEVYISEPQKITTIKVPEPTTSKEDATRGQFIKISKESPKTALITYAPSIERQRDILREVKMNQDQLRMNEESPSQRLRVQYDVDHLSAAGEILLNDGYFVHFFAPSANTLDHSAKPSKHVIFVLDTSGSMYLRKLDQVKEAMGIILDSLTEKDYFSIVQFSSFVKEWYLSHEEQDLEQSVHLAIPANIHSAKIYISNMEAEGGTNIDDALTVALKVAESGPGINQLKGVTYPRSISTANGALNKAQPIIIFLTDGEPTSGNTNLSSILYGTKERNNKIKVPIYSLAFGDQCDFKFLRKLSLQNYGFARKIYSSADAALQLESFFQEISSPLLNNVTFSYVSPVVDKSTLTKSTFHVYYDGTEIIIAGRVKNKIYSPDDLRGMVSSTYYEVPISGRSLVRDPLIHRIPKPIYPPYPGESRGKHTEVIKELEAFAVKFWPSRNFNHDTGKHKLGSLERLWAFLTIRQLLDEDLASEEEKGSKWQSSEEIQGKDTTSPAKEKALQLALQYSFVTPLTSLVVVKPSEKYYYSGNDTVSISDPLDESFNRHFDGSNLIAHHGTGWFATTSASSPRCLLSQSKVIAIFFVQLYISYSEIGVRRFIY